MAATVSRWGARSVYTHTYAHLSRFVLFYGSMRRYTCRLLRCHYIRGGVNERVSIDMQMSLG